MLYDMGQVLLLQQSDHAASLMPDAHLHISFHEVLNNHFEVPATQKKCDACMKHHTQYDACI